MTLTAFVSSNPLLVMLGVCALVVLLRTRPAVAAGSALLAGVRDAAGGRRTPAPPAPADEPVPLVPLYRRTPDRMAVATTEDLSDAALQMRQELLRRREQARDRADALTRLLPPDLPAGLKPPPVAGI